MNQLNLKNNQSKMKALLITILILFGLTCYSQQFSFSPPHLFRKVPDYQLVKSNAEFNYSYKLNKNFKLETKYIYSYLTNKYKFEANTHNRLYTLEFNKNNRKTKHIINFYNVTAIQYDTKKFSPVIGLKVSYRLPWKFYDRVKISADIGVSDFNFNKPYYLNIKTTYDLWP